MNSRMLWMMGWMAPESPMTTHILQWKITNLKDGVGDDCAGQFRLYEDEISIEKSPKFLESEANLGAEKPIGSKSKLQRFLASIQENCCLNASMDLTWYFLMVTE